MKIAYWCNSFFYDFGGAEIVVADMLNAMSDRSHRCYLLASTNRKRVVTRVGPELDPQIEVFQAPFHNPADSLKWPIRLIINELNIIFEIR